MMQKFEEVDRVCHESAVMKDEKVSDVLFEAKLKNRWNVCLNQ